MFYVVVIDIFLSYIFSKPNKSATLECKRTRYPNALMMERIFHLINQFEQSQSMTVFKAQKKIENAIKSFN